jgi:hypothetical protein
MVKAAVVGGEEEETRQAKEMAAAKRRWDALVISLYLVFCVFWFVKMS